MIKVLDVLVTGAPPKQVIGCAIDEPEPGTTVDGHVLKIRGWVAGLDEPPDAIRVVHEGRMIKEVRTSPIGGRGVPRREPDRTADQRRSFWVGVGALGLPPEFEVSVRAFFKRRGLAEVAVIRGRHSPVRSGFAPRRAPLMVTTLARTGSTWLMHLIGHHPEILVHRRYPYEMVPNRYWAHLLKVMSDPADFRHWAMLDPFHGDLHRIGHNPYFSQAVEEIPELEAWFAGEHVERVARLCQELTEAYYDRVAHHQAEERTTYFAEKHVHGPTQWILWELYPGAREVFLVRDPRDMIASMEAFNRKRGYPAFGREAVGSEDEWFRRMDEDYRLLLEARDARSDRAHLLRYEDLVLDPDRALVGLFEYLEIEHSPSLVADMLARASEDMHLFEGHRTARDARSSIGRWKELPGRARRRLETTFTDVAERLGYA